MNKEKEMEKLVEEIIAIMVWNNSHVAKKLITRIGKAYADGEVKLPREVRRVLAEYVCIGEKIIWRGADKRYRFIILKQEPE